MKIDLDYLKGLLEAFEASSEPTTDIEQLKDAGFDYNDKLFIFHMRILADRNLVEQPDGEFGFGAILGVDGQISWSVLPLRLTSAGHEFVAALRNKEVWATINTNLKDGRINTLLDISKKLMEAYTTRKLEQILGANG